MKRRALAKHNDTFPNGENATAKRRDALRTLWAKTIPDPDVLTAGDPGLTYKPQPVTPAGRSAPVF